MQPINVSKLQQSRRVSTDESTELAFDMFKMNETGSVNNFTGNHRSTVYLSRDDSPVSPITHKGDYESSTNSQRQNMGRTTILFLITLGAVAGIVNGLIIQGNNGLAYAQARIIASFDDYAAGLFTFMTTTAVFVYLAACLCKYVSNRAAGSGLPELKALLSSELKSDLESKNLVSSRALFAKIFGLILALGSCLSIGSEGPLVHTASCLAFFIMRHVYEFETILSSPNFLRQVDY